MSGSQDPRFTPLWQFIMSLVALWSSFEDLSFLKFSTKNFSIFKTFVTPKFIFHRNFSSLAQNFLKLQLFSLYFCQKKISSLDSGFGTSHRTPPPISKASPPLDFKQQISRYSIRSGSKIHHNIFKALSSLEQVNIS